MSYFCDRCDRWFKTQRAYRQHVDNFQSHWECPECDFDGESRADLIDHCRDEGCRDYCQGCDGGTGRFWVPDSHAYWWHVEDENVCTQCERHFQSSDNLAQHNLSHRTRDYECLMCDQKFKTYGGMIIYLESGCCSYVDRIELNQLAVKYPRWSEFVDEDYYSEMLQGQDIDAMYGRVELYFCPDCGAWLYKLSSLFQHVESQACSQTLYDGAIGDLRQHLAYYL
jgi:DNA-directed RNA polymerase subunit RPC12/RpoP